MIDAPRVADNLDGLLQAGRSQGLGCLGLAAGYQYKKNDRKKLTHIADEFRRKIAQKRNNHILTSVYPT